MALTDSFIRDSLDTAVDKFQHTSIIAFDLLVDVLLFCMQRSQNYVDVPWNILKNYALGRD